MKDKNILLAYEKCTLCSRNCAVNRNKGEYGYCGMDSRVFLGRADLHMWEEPSISGTRGSGTVFFVGCSLGCIFCQNHKISGVIRKEQTGSDVDIDGLCDVMLKLEDKGAHNINLVTPTHYIPSIVEAVKAAKIRGLDLPIVYNTGSYESEGALDMLRGTVDIYLADFKFLRQDTAKLYANAPDYPEVAKAAIAKMYSQRGPFVIKDGIMRSGVIVRILLLPGHLAEAKLTVKYLYETYGNNIYISLMNQYTPMMNMPAPLSRRVTEEEYRELVDYAISKGITNAYVQEEGTASESFIPSFDGVL